MLGSSTDAEDAVQESFLRLNRSDSERVDDLRAWLTTVAARVCLDMLRARRARREDYVGSSLPEPVVSIDDGTDPEHEAVLADSVGLAMLVVLDTLTPAERIALLLHELSALPFDKTPPIVAPPSPAAPQLPSRARRRVKGSAPVPDAA